MLRRLAPRETTRSLFLADLFLDLWALSDGSHVCVRFGAVAVRVAQGVVDLCGDLGVSRRQRSKEDEVLMLDKALPAQAPQVASPPR